MLKHNGGEDRGSRRHVAGTTAYRVRGHHAGSGITFRRTYRNSCFQFAIGIEKPCALCSQRSGIFSGNKNFWQNVTE